MSLVIVRLREPGACRVLHRESGATFDTDSPPEFGGQGRAFSATDLLAAALGACIASSIDSVALRQGIPLDAIEVRVRKRLAAQPKRVEWLGVTVSIAALLDEALQLKLRRAAEACSVHRSLHPDVVVELVLQSVAELPKAEDS